MRNIWILLSITIIACAGLIGISIYQFTKKPDFYILKIVLCFACSVYLFVSDLPYMKDLVAHETTVIIAEYDDFQSSNTSPGTRKLFFVVDGQRISLIIPTVTRAVAKLIPGKTYEIVYFNNSKVIKSYRLIE